MECFKNKQMKNLVIVFAIGIILASCGSSKKAATSAQVPPIEVIEEKVIIKPQEELPVPVPPAVPEVPEIIEKPDVIEEEPPVEETTPDIENLPEPEIVEVVEEVVEVEETIGYPNHTSFNQLLSTHVSPQGNVNYSGFKSNWSALRAYIVDLGANLPTDTWSKEDKLSYWMNAYNAMTVDLILRNQPIASIKDIKDPWDQRLWKLGSKWYNLNEIEHQILRKMGDARIHFGINCASFSCPPLLNEAFTAATVDAQLDALSRKFVNDSKRNTITANSIEVSKIFNWFAKDFKTSGTLIDFLNKYSDTPIAANAKKRFKDYDWTLNE